MATIYDVLAHIGQRMPHLGMVKAFKLAYYAQAWHATWEGRPLYTEHTEAWAMGPVCRAGWTAVKRGDQRPTHSLTGSESSVVDAVIKFYGQMDGRTLGELSHNEDPWRDARGDAPDGQRCDEEISVASMRRYYTRKLMRGEPAPERPTTPAEPVPDEVAMTVAREQADRWREALELLADR